MKQFLLLTGGTGLLGRYLVRDLLASGVQLAVLARDRRGESAAGASKDSSATGNGN